MKKLLLLTTLVGISGLAHATTINAPSSLIGTISGEDAYSWGISIAVPTGQTVSSAEIDFTSVTLGASGNSEGTGTFYTDLLNSKKTGVTTVYDGNPQDDYWAGVFHGANITPVGSESFASVGTTLTWSYILDQAQLTALNSYLTDNNGVFNIGITPDCHYNVGNICFTYDLGPSPHGNSVPDVATTAFLLLLGLTSLEVFRRQFVAVKMKA
jgi:hypothetical protein